MTELSLYKFIEDSGSMTSYDGEKAIIWVYHFNLDDFVELIGTNVLLDDGGLEIRLQEHHLAIEMNDICEYNNIELEKVFKKD